MTVPHFTVGEIAIMHGCDSHPNYNGTECTIIEPLRVRPVKLGDLIDLRECYVCQLCDGGESTVDPRCLRKRDDGAGDWDELREVWQPKAEETAV